MSRGCSIHRTLNHLGETSVRVTSHLCEKAFRLSSAVVATINWVLPFWFNVVTKRVETDDDRSQITDLLGPFSTHAEAERALDSAHACSKQWDNDDDAGQRA